MPRTLAPDLAFRRLLVIALATAGCPKPPVDAGATPPPAPTETTGTAPVCDAPLLFAGGIKPAQAVDAVTLREARDHMGRPSRTVLASDGELCGAAADGSCLDRAEQLWQAAPIRQDCGQIGCTSLHLTFSNGEETGTVPSVDALREFLGPIDTAAEARLIAWASGFDIACLPTEDGAAWKVAAREYVSDCPMQTDDVALSVAADGTLTEVSRTQGPPGPCVGRLAPGLCDRPTEDGTVAQWLAAAAHMEAVSAHAFEVLARELEHHGAPQELIDAARAAVTDELRHARIMGALAHQHDEPVAEVRIEPLPIRSLEAIAVDNAAEGLGRESWGALLALWQCKSAADADVRVAMASIAIDEVRHAEFSRALHAWLLPQLTAEAAARTQAAQSDAWSTLAEDALRPRSPGMHAALGLPMDPTPLLEAARQAGLASAQSI